MSYNVAALIIPKNHGELPISHLQPEDSYAIFIDAQSSSNIEQNEFAFQHIEKYMPSHCQSSVKRIYGHADLLKTLKPFMLQYGLHAPYHFPNKALPHLHNIDGLMIMDITEAMYKYPDIKVFIIFSSDGDFVPVVQKLRKAGKIVIVYVRGKITSPALLMVCSHFVNIGEEATRINGVNKCQK